MPKPTADNLEMVKGLRDGKEDTAALEAAIQALRAKQQELDA